MLLLAGLSVALLSVIAAAFTAFYFAIILTGLAKKKARNVAVKMKYRVIINCFMTQIFIYQCPENKVVTA